MKFVIKKANVWGGVEQMAPEYSEWSTSYSLITSCDERSFAFDRVSG
jgi:hypothetical protein